MKFIRYILLLSAIILYLTLTFSVGAKQNQQHPQDVLIRQVLTATATELGWDTSVSLNTGTYVDNKIYRWSIGVEYTTGAMNLYAFNSESEAKKYFDASVPKLDEYNDPSHFTVRLYPACSFNKGSRLMAQADHFLIDVFTHKFYDPNTTETDAKKFLEAFYQNAESYGLFAGDGDFDIQPDGTEENLLLDPSIHISLQPTYFKNLGDRINIQATYIDVDSLQVAGIKVTLNDLDTNSKVAESITDTNGRVNFVIEHQVESKKVYTFQLQTAMLSKTITIPVVGMGISIEINSVTGEPFKGLIADGESSLEVLIKLEGVAASGELKIKNLPSTGKLTGKAIRSGSLIYLNNDEASLFYIAPDYLKTNELIWNDANTSIWAAIVPLEFTYTFDDGKTEDFGIEILILRPPVMLIHGFTGDKTTWSNLSEYLKTRKYDTHIGEYYAGNQSIWEQSNLLRDNISEKKDIYLLNNIKISKVDLIAHSMGGLISRFYVNTRFKPWFDPKISWDSFYRNDVRKLIMVGTPNHGCSSFDLQTGRLISFFSNKHDIAAEQLYSEGDFITNLNKYESMGLHLNRKVEYGNIYSWSAYPGFFNGDGVVSASSAYLNGVASYRIQNHVHSPAVLNPWVNVNQGSITESLTVFTKVEEWLQSKIYRPALDNMRIYVTKTEGEVYIQDPLQMKDGIIPKTYITTASLVKGVSMNSFDFLCTGKDSKATISFFINNKRWGSIYLDQNTELRLGYLSPKLVEVMLNQGSARFSSLKIDKGGHFSVNLEADDGKWHNITGLDTDFVAFVGSEIHAYSFDGQLFFEIETESGNIITKTISTGEAVMKTESDVVVSNSEPQPQWWTNKFYNRSLFDTMYCYLCLLYGETSDLLGIIQTGSWKYLAFTDLAGFSLLATIIVILIAFIIITVIIIRKKKHNNTNQAKQ